jgi:hypothetical protein
MKSFYTLLVAGMLAMATASPAVQARTFASSAHTYTKLTITDELAYQILDLASGELEAQLNTSLSTSFLMSEYKAGRVTITYLGDDGIGDVFHVNYQDGLGTVLVEEF